MPVGCAGPPDDLRAAAMSGMDDAVKLSNGDRLYLAEVLAAGPPGDVLIAVDDIDGALKVKVAGRWSPPIGVLEQRGATPVDAGRSNRDDLAAEHRAMTLDTTVHPLTCQCFGCVDPADLR